GGCLGGVGVSPPAPTPGRPGAPAPPLPPVPPASARPRRATAVATRQTSAQPAPPSSRHPPPQALIRRTVTRQGAEGPYTHSSQARDRPASGGAPSCTPILWVSCGRARVVIAWGGRQHGKRRREPPA